jgi:hypothetical protein
MRLLSLLGFFCSIVFAQGQFGTIGGVVKDTSGAVVPGVSVSVVNSATGQSATGTSGEDGRYLVPQLLPGVYNLALDQPGFKRVVINGIRLEINQNIAQDLTLEVGAVTETVSVSSSGSLVETVAGSVGHVVENKEITELPLNGRNVFDLVALTPGSFLADGDVSISGGRTTSASALLDGVTNSRGGIGEQNIEINPPVDIMQEFRVEANAFSAQYGRSNGGIVNASTKSGTNEIHGLFYEFLRNDVLDSRGWNADVKAPLRRNQFGGAVGGPVAKNRTFYFYNYDGFRERRGVARTRTVPLAEWRTGNFSGLQRQVNSPAGPVGQPLVIYDPLTGQRSPFPGNIVPAERLDAVSAKTIAQIPLPNRAPDNPITQAGNWQQNSVNYNTRDHHTVRIDHSFSDSTKIFGRYILVTPDKADVGPAAGFGASDTNAMNDHSRRQNLSLNLTRVVSPTTFATFRAGLNRAYTVGSGVGLGEDWPSKLGLKGVAQDVFPRFNMSSGLVPTTNFGTADSHHRRAAFTTTEAHADFTKIHGAHTLKFGGSTLRFNGNENNRQISSGSFTFSTRYTTGINGSGGNIAGTGMTFADFMLGRPTEANLAITDGNARRSQYYSGYLEDGWRASPNLTFTLGIRYELETPVYEVHNRMSNFDPYAPHPLAGTRDIPAGVRGVVTFPGRNGYGERLVDWDANNLAPRFGFNWRPFGDNSTVVRGGFGLFYGNPYNRNAFKFGGLGFNAKASYREPVPFTLAQGLPAVALQRPLESDLTSAFGTRGTPTAVSQVQFLDPHRRTQYSENVNMTVQREFRDLFFELGYLANLGRKVPFATMNLNHIPAELLARTEIPARLRRPYPQFDSDTPQIQVISPNWGISNYHAFMFKSERRFKNGYGWIFSYTWSKWIDNVNFVGGAFGDDDGIQNIYDIRNERSLSANHVPHRAVLSPVVELPFGRGRRWVSNGGPLDWFIGGWQISGIMTLQSGSPFGVTVVNGPRDILGDNANGKNLRPNIVGDMRLHGGQQGAPAVSERGIQWFNPAAFAAPARFTYGNAARTLMLGPGLVNFDSAIAKSFRIGERYRLQFRWEAFNAFNTPAFALPASGLGGPGFGVATAGASDREMQFALKLYH